MTANAIKRKQPNIKGVRIFLKSESKLPHTSYEVRKHIVVIEGYMNIKRVFESRIHIYSKPELIDENLEFIIPIDNVSSIAIINKNPIVNTNNKKEDND